MIFALKVSRILSLALLSLRLRSGKIKPLFILCSQGVFQVYAENQTLNEFSGAKQLTSELLHTCTSIW